MKLLFLITLCFYLKTVSANEVNQSQIDLLPYKSIYLTKNSNRMFFAISAKYPMIVNPDGLNELNYNIYFAYSQKSIWRPSDASGNDENFLYTNFNPEVFYTYDFRNSKNIPLTIQTGFEHESDGLGKIFDGQHREWDRFYIYPQYSIDNDLFRIGYKIWYASLDLKYNSNIAQFMGFSELKMSTNYLKKYHNPLIEVTIRKGSTTKLNDFTFIIEERFALLDMLSETYKSPFTFYAQYFSGYGEYLKSYNHKTTNVRLGLSILY